MKMVARAASIALARAGKYSAPDSSNTTSLPPRITGLRLSNHGVATRVGPLLTGSSPLLADARARSRRRSPRVCRHVRALGLERQFGNQRTVVGEPRPLRAAQHPCVAYAEAALVDPVHAQP